MTLIHTFTLGSLRCHALEGGLQRLDGGAMFGVVPKPLWERRAPPDTKNRRRPPTRARNLEKTSRSAMARANRRSKGTSLPASTRSAHSSPTRFAQKKMRFLVPEPLTAASSARE